ncbi:MAG: ferric iron uptake transcriptional regulator [Immundisolibacteraceae bacterium]|nr:ferric iron uptake transcriptional regulator [Immundisolibacteraceae bacterium]
MTTSEALRKVGLKATLPRIKIFEFLQRIEERHLSAENIYQAMLADHEEVGLATIYRVLTQFEAAGLVIRHHFEGDRSLFELGTNKGANHHDHLVCIGCGTIQEFFDEVIEQTQIEVAKRFGYKIIDHNLHIQGLCGSCQEAAEKG